MDKHTPANLFGPGKVPRWDFKLLVDPFLVKGGQKQYRVEGQQVPPLEPTDPRIKQLVSHRERKCLDLKFQIPNFKVDKNYEGPPPPLEVTISNINDNIDKAFLGDLVSKYGSYEELTIFYHPVKKRHLGLAKVLFSAKKYARCCVDKMNGLSVMGKILDVFLDPRGATRKKMYNELITEPKHEPKPKPKEKEEKEKEKVENNGTPTIDLKTSTENEIILPQDPTKSETLPFSSTSFPFSHFPPISTDDPLSNYIMSTTSEATPKPPWPSGPVPGVNNYASNNRSTFPPLKEENSFIASPKMDLDTRIKLLMKSKTTCDLGRLFGLSSESEDESDKFKNHTNAHHVKSNSHNHNTQVCPTGKKRKRKNKENSKKTEDIVESNFKKKFRKNTFKPVDAEPALNKENTPPPSPFLSNATIMDARTFPRPLDADLDAISEDSINSSEEEDEEEDEDEDDDDNMSLSSLSPEESTAIRLPTNKSFLPTTVPPQDHAFTPGFPNLPANLSTTYPLQNQPFYNLPPNYHPSFHSFPPHLIPWANGNGLPPPPPPLPQVAPPLPPPVPPPPPPPPPDLDTWEGEEEEESEEIREEHVEKLITDAALEKLYNDLKYIIHRDLQKRIIENVAYKRFEEWWHDREQEQKENEALIQLKQQEKTAESAAHAPRSTINNLFGESRLNDIIRARIPKLPNYRKKLPTPSPPRRIQSDSEESEKSDSEKEEITRKRARRISLSSEISSSSESSSSSFSDSDSESLISVKPFSPSSKKSDDDGSRLSAQSISDAGTFSESEKENKKKKEEEKKEISPKLTADLKQVREDVIKEPSPPPQPLTELEHLFDHNYFKIDEDRPPPYESESDDQTPASEREKLAILKQVTLKKRITKRKPKVESPVYASPSPPPLVVFKPRSEGEKEMVLYEFLHSGLDEEDYNYIRQSFQLLSTTLDGPQYSWLKSVQWTPYPLTPPSPHPSLNRSSSRRFHTSGCVRTEGYYKYNIIEKRRQKANQAIYEEKLGLAPSHETRTLKMHTISREMRSNQRRILNALGNELDSDLLKFNQLKFRKKSLRFAKSPIHDWGLFAAESIAADEMVIEYVGQAIRSAVADVREKKYEAVGIGSSYLFRVDTETVIDATRSGNLSRFINHSCTPNCYAKIITIEGRKKIVIYSKVAIGMNEEITYDYKFPIEDEKIPCLCGSSQCRGTLN